MKVIDFRFRPNTPEIINGIKNSTMFKAACEVIGFDQRKPQPLDEIVADLDAMGVELGVITGRDAETTYGFPANNNSVLEFCRAYPNKFVGLWGIDPHKKMAAVREIEKVVKEYGMKGIAIAPYLAHMPASDARFYPLYTNKVARDFPELTLIMSHGGYPFVDAAIYTCQRNANVYMDISEYERSPQVETYVKAMCTTISDKVLFASAHPFIELRDALDAYAAFPFTDEVRNKIMYENARKVLKLA